MSTPRNLQPRLLSRKDAAAYCGMSTGSFDRVCTVTPIDVGLKNPLYDRHALDLWIDALEGNIPHRRDWLAAFDDDRHVHADKGH